MNELVVGKLYQLKSATGNISLREAPSWYEPGVKTFPLKNETAFQVIKVITNYDCTWINKSQRMPDRLSIHILTSDGFSGWMNLYDVNLYIFEELVQ